MHGHPRAGRDPCVHRRAHGAAGFHTDDPVRRPGGLFRQGPRRLPGGRLRRRLRSTGQVGGRDRRAIAHRGIRHPRLRHRHAGPPGPGGPRPARGQAARARRPVGSSARRGGPRRTGRIDAPDHRTAPARSVKAAGDPGRVRLDAGCSGLPVGLAGGPRSTLRPVVPAQGPDHQRPPLLRRRPRPRPEPEAGPAGEGRRPAAGDRRAPGRKSDPRLHFAQCPAHGQDPDPHPPGTRGAGTGVADARGRRRRRFARGAVDLQHRSGQEMDRLA